VASFLQVWPAGNHILHEDDEKIKHPVVLYKTLYYPAILKEFTNMLSRIFALIFLTVWYFVDIIYSEGGERHLFIKSTQK